MLSNPRALVPYALLALFVSAVVWATSFGTLPPAEFTFCNGTEVESIDPAVVNGQPEGRIVYAIFDGLFRVNPVDAEPMPGICTTLDVTQDNIHFVFPLRKDALWSDGSPITAHDFAWSLRRFLHPETGAKYAYQMWYAKGGKQYTSLQIKVGEPVEVELANRPVEHQQFPSGDFVRGVLREVRIGDKAQTTDAEGYVKSDEQNVYVVADAEGKLRRFSKKPAKGDDDKEGGEKVERAMWVLPDFEKTVGIRAKDDHTLEIDLESPTPFFSKLMCFYPMFPVNRRCIEKYGNPLWTKAENLVSNGAYRMEFRRIRDRIRLQKSPTYWNHAAVSINTIDALTVSAESTMLNMYLSGQVDWITAVPTSVIQDLAPREDFEKRPILPTYFYRLNTKNEQLKDVRVRQALNLATDKQEIVEFVTRAGQIPADAFVPPGLGPYEAIKNEDGKPPRCGTYNPEAARKLLAEAGYPDGQNFKPIEILTNASEAHRVIAEKVQEQWKKNLGIDVRVLTQEWAVFQASTATFQYEVARAGWGADYADPNTFLDMWVKDGKNNETGWHNDEYDRLIAEAASAHDPQARLRMLKKAEAILLEELPILPFYYYVKTDMVRDYVQGWHGNVLDVHPLDALSIDAAKRAQQRQSEGLRH